MIAGDLVFGTRLGFSGTPSDLLPVELKPCAYERGDDARMLHYLTDPAIVGHHALQDSWGVQSTLDMIATANPPYHALIDTGALVTGLNNFEVAKYLLETGLKEMDGVVFLDEEDRKIILLRGSGSVMKLEQSGVPMAKRFSFYDQVCRHRTMFLKNSVCTSLTYPHVSRTFLARFSHVSRTFLGRLADYDQCHTTGMDIKQDLNARGATFF